MNLSRAAICVFGLILMVPEAPAMADDLENQTRALKVIRETAADICNTIAQEGSSQVVELSGDVKAKLGGAVAKIADLGIQGVGKYRTEEFRGPLQQELALAIKDNSNCRFEVLKLLQEKMLGPGKSGQPTKGINTVNTVNAGGDANAVNNVTGGDGNDVSINAVNNVTADGSARGVNNVTASQKATTLQRERPVQSKPANETDRSCPADSNTRREIIAKLSNARSRDFEYGTLIMDLLECKSFNYAVGVALKMRAVDERDGSLSAVAMTAMKDKSFEAARRAIEMIIADPTRDQLSRIFIAEMHRKREADPTEGTWGSDLIQLSYGSLGGVIYNYRTGEISNEFQLCASGRASCASTTPGYNVDPIKSAPGFIPDPPRPKR
jgi:hypothetical protein